MQHEVSMMVNCISAEWLVGGLTSLSDIKFQHSNFDNLQYET